MTKETLKIGNAGGYWGDDPHALERQVFGGRLDYISMDFLAEITMSIMQKQRSRDPELGYAKDFIPMLNKVLKKTLADGTTIITNAGGVNPAACAKAIEDMAKDMGLNPKIAVVYGDDILESIDRLYDEKCKFDNMETGEAFERVKPHLEAANIYFGAKAVVEALKWNPDIVITGRVTDTGITVAPMIYEFGWDPKDWDKIASGIIAGHMMECGTQATGGNFTDWQRVPSFEKVGFPIAEVNKDGSFVITKHPGTGGLVSYDTIREQTFYEMGDPKGYITPDVIADFSTIRLEHIGENRVQVSGIKGYEPTPFYKVSMAYRDGYKAVGSILISGPDARKKAEAFAKIFWNRIDANLTAKETEYFGWNACQRSLNHQSEANEILLRLGARSTDKAALRSFGKMVPSLILSGPPGVAVTGGVPRAQEVISYWPALMPKEKVRPKIARFEAGKLVDEQTIEGIVSGNFKPQAMDSIQICESANQTIAEALAAQDHPDAVCLSELCLGRSGDKGDTCNIGLLARGEVVYQWIKENITAQVIKNWYQELCFGKVIRYELDGLNGLNFLLEQSLGGGGTMTLRSDAQGKTFAQALLAQKVIVPQSVRDAAKKYNEAIA